MPRRAPDERDGTARAHAEEWPGLQAALAQSEREAHEAALLEERSAVADVLEAERREAAEIAEALRLVEEAMRKEREEFEDALRAVALAESSNDVEPYDHGVHPPACVPSSHRGDRNSCGGSGSMASAAQAVGDPEQQLAACMELGFHAELAAPYCDGLSSLEEIVEQLTELTTGSEGDAFVAGEHARARGKPSSSRRWHGVARRFWGTA